MLAKPQHIPLQPLQDATLATAGVDLYMKREDLIHPYISGNKWRKLRYILQDAQAQGYRELLTFGGAYSNHLLAVAAAAHQQGWKSIGIVRGEEHLPLNHNLAKAAELGMELSYLSRGEYRQKESAEVLNPLKAQFPQAYFIPEGGSCTLALPGCAEIAEDLVALNPDFIALACGTGGTLAGLALGAQTLMPQTKILGFPALKGGDFLGKAIANLQQGQLNRAVVQALPWAWPAHPKPNCQLFTQYHFGGYAKKKPELLDFMRQFYQAHQIPLDFVYTGKMAYGLYDLIKKGFFPSGSRIVAIHTGGLHNGSIDSCIRAQ